MASRALLGGNDPRTGAWRTKVQASVREFMSINAFFFVLVIVTGLATLGSLIAGLVVMSRALPDSNRESNTFMWWRIRLQALTLVWMLLWWVTRS